MILVIAEQRDGRLNRATWEAVAAAQQLAGSMPVSVAVLGGTTAGVAHELAEAAVAEVLVAEHPALESYTQAEETHSEYLGMHFWEMP